MKREIPSSKLLIGADAPYFSLSATDGKIYSIGDFAGSELLAVIFTCNHCPYAQAYDNRLVQLTENYSDSQLQLVCICSNDSSAYPGDSFENMIEKSKKLGFAFPYLHDADQSVAKAYDAACTPEVFLFDKERKLSYQGEIDDNHSDPLNVKNDSLKDAIDSLLNSKTPATQQTYALGCSIKWKA